MPRTSQPPRLVLKADKRWRRYIWVVRWTDGRTREVSTGTSDPILAKAFLREFLFVCGRPVHRGGINGDIGKILTRLYGRARHNAKARGYKFEISRDYIDVLYRKCGGHCMVTGIEFDLSEKTLAGKRRAWTPSIDRIDSTEGYTRGNCRMVCSAVNIAMNQWGEEVLLRIAAALHKNGKIR